MISGQSKKRIALAFGGAGIGLMGVDLLITRSIFIHTAEMMLASITCFCIALVVDARANSLKTQKKTSDQP